MLGNLTKPNYLNLFGAAICILNVEGHYCDTSNLNIELNLLTHDHLEFTKFSVRKLFNYLKAETLGIPFR